MHILPAPKEIITKPQFYLFGSLFLLILGGGIFSMIRYQQLARELASVKASATTNTDIAALVAEVGQLMILPEGEQPTIATVNEVDKLQGQPFFANARNGDKVLVYAAAKKAVLYRPSEKKIVEVAPINLNDQTVSATASGAPELVNANLNPTPVPVKGTLVIRNGSGILGAVQKFETDLQSKISGLNILDRQTSSRPPQAYSLVVDVSGDQPQAARSLASALGLEVGELPSGEATPSSDFLIILGTDKK